MKDTAMQRRADGTAEIYRSGRQYLRVSGDDGEPRWLKRTSRGLRPVSDHRARQLDRIFRHPETAKAFRRRPRLEWERKPGQPVYCPAFGFGQIVAIQGDKVTAKFGHDERVVSAHDLMTRAQAESDWHFYWLTGERRRLEEGRRLMIIKSLCRFGEWQKFLRKFNYPRSSADDLIRRYKNEIRWAARNQLPGYRAIETGDPGRQTNKYTEAPEGRERRELVKAEAEKRHGKEPTDHKTRWLIGIELPPNVVVLCRKKYKREGKRAKKYWRHAAYKYVGFNPPHAKHHHKVDPQRESK